MGLAQNIKFIYNKEDLEKLLLQLGYSSEGKLFIKENDAVRIELAVEDYGLYIHRSHEYIYDFGLLVEALGNITCSITIEDQ